jgi:hypothetical protein
MAKDIISMIRGRTKKFKNVTVPIVSAVATIGGDKVHLQDYSGMPTTTAGGDNLGNHIATQTISGANIVPAIYLKNTSTNPTIAFETTALAHNVNISLKENEASNDHLVVESVNPGNVDMWLDINCMSGSNAIFCLNNSRGTTNRGYATYSSGDIFRFTNDFQNGDIAFNCRDSSGTADFLRIDSSANRIGVGRSNTSPAETLDISGSSITRYYATLGNATGRTIANNSFFLSGGLLCWKDNGGAHKIVTLT